MQDQYLPITIASWNGIGAVILHIAAQHIFFKSLSAVLVISL